MPEARLRHGASHETRLYHLGATAPKRSTLADANALRPADVFVELFQTLLAQAHPGLRRGTKEAVRLIDSTSVSLSTLSNDWASYEAHGAGAKLHVVFDPNAVTPVHFAITAQRSSDIGAAKAMPIESGATYVFDLGYYDFAWWAKLAAKDCTFVTRLKSHTKTTVVAERPLPTGGGGRVLKDRTVRLPGRLKGTRRHPLACDLREIHVVIETGKTLRIVSNDLTSPAEAIADLYQTRWQIELFFRAVEDGFAYGGQTDPQDQDVPRHDRECRAHSIGRRHDRLPAAAHCPRRATRRQKPADFRPARTVQSHAFQNNPRPCHPATATTHQDLDPTGSCVVLMAERNKPDSRGTSPRMTSVKLMHQNFELRHH